MRRLLWYFVACLLFIPLIAAPFTAFESLVLYYAYFVEPKSILYIGVAPAVLLWLINQFFVFTFRPIVWKLRNRLYGAI
jgi:hypothetical protein